MKFSLTSRGRYIYHKLFTWRSLQSRTVINPVKFGEDWTMDDGVIHNFLFCGESPKIEALPRSHGVTTSPVFDNVSSSMSGGGTDQVRSWWDKICRSSYNFVIYGEEGGATETAFDENLKRLITFRLHGLGVGQTEFEVDWIKTLGQVRSFTSTGNHPKWHK